MHFVNENTGTVVGDFGTVLRTTDGGVNWTEQVAPRRPLKDVFFTDANTGTIVGQRAILRTTDGGETWEEYPFESPRIIYGVFFTDSDTGTFVGERGMIFRTIDGGSTWNRQDTLVVVSALQSIVFTTPDRAISVGGASILHTYDAGTTWVRRTAERAGLRGYFDVWFLDETTGIIVGAGGTILRTTTGGE